jgi:hypothetical protein
MRRAGQSGRLPFHEDFGREPAARRFSDRSFGLVWAIVLLAAGAWPLLRHGHPRVALLAAGAVFLAVALAIPRVLAPAARGWHFVGRVLQRITTPIVLSIFFFAIVTPVGLCMRLVGRRPLALGKDPGRASYWTPRAPDSPAERASMRDPF